MCNLTDLTSFSRGINVYCPEWTIQTFESFNAEKNLMLRVSVAEQLKKVKDFRKVETLYKI